MFTVRFQREIYHSFPRVPSQISALAMFMRSALHNYVSGFPDRSLDYPAVRDLLSVFRFQSHLTDLYEQICLVVIKNERDPHKFRVPCGDLSKKLIWAPGVHFQGLQISLLDLLIETTLYSGV